MKKKTEDIIITIRFNRSDYEQLKKEADERRLPLGSYLRMIILSKKEGR